MINGKTNHEITISNVRLEKCEKLIPKMPRFKFKYILFIICAVIILRYFGVFLHFFERDYYNDFHYPYDGDVNVYVEQLRNNEKPDVPPMNVYNYSFIHDCSKKCKDVDLRLVYVIKSAPDNFDRRLAIRNSWGYERRFSDVSIRTIFILGSRDDPDQNKRIKAENDKFGDIVQADFYDTYFNNTIKTMMGFRWAVTYCPKSKFYMFVDDDFYVSTKNVLRFIRNPTNYPNYLKEPFFHAQEKINARVRKSKRQVMNFELPDEVKLYSGYVFIASPHRHRTSKWYVSLEEYPYHMWPPYVTAGSYVLSREALRTMYFTSFYTKHFRFDDIYLGLVALKANIEPYHCEEFHFYKLPYNILDYTYVISSHGYGNPNELLQVWNEQRSAGNA